MSRRRWNPDHHPRDRIGRFTDSPGGGWAARAATQLGERRRAPDSPTRNAEDVKIGDVVNVRGKHRTITGYSRRDGQDVELRYKEGFATFRWGEKVEVGRPVDWGMTPPKGDDAKLMHQWRRDAMKPGRKTESRFATQRDLRLHQERQELENRKAIRADASPEDIRNPNSQVNIDVRMSENAIRYLETSDEPIFDKPPQTGGRLVLAQDPNPRRPLAVYGDMLQLGGGMASFEAAKVINDIPIEFHLPVARDMAEIRSGGIHIGPKTVGDFPKAKDLRDVQPRGWGADKTWMDVGGAYRPDQRVLFTGYESGSSRLRVRGTAAHEFGHALDRAMGHLSNSVQWRSLHKDVLDNKLVGFNPYFEQSGHAGAQEFFAEAFSSWARLLGESTADRRVVMRDQLRIDGSSAAAIDEYLMGLRKRLRGEYDAERRARR